MADSTKTIAKLLPVLTGIAGIAIAAGAYFMLLAPKLSLFAKGGLYDLAELTITVQEDDAYVTRLATAVEGYRTLNSQRRQKIQAVVPVGIDAPGIIATVDAIVQGHTMVLKSIDVTPLDDEIGLAGQLTARVSVNVEGGTYEDLKLFLMDLERSRRLFDVESLVMTPITAQYALQLKAYYLPEEVAIGPGAAAATDQPPPQSIF